jgi:tetratricopeptide (TPR) repeat protein
MNGRSARALVVAAVAVIVFGVISVRLQALRDDLPLATSDSEALYLTERAAGRAVFTFRPLAADLYWIRAIQYFGGHTRVARARQHDSFEPPPSVSAAPVVSFDQLYPLLDITTTLDSRFNIAYRFGAIFLAAGYPDGPGRPDLAVALLEKGLKASPGKWEYWHDIGFVYYWNTRDYRKASEALQRGAELPGAPWWLRSMAATMLAKGGDRETSRLLWRELYETANNDYARIAARMKLMQLDAIEQIEQLQTLVDRVAARSGEPVTSWRALAAMGVVRRVPQDPSGVPYTLLPTGRVGLSEKSTLFPLPLEPGVSTRQ